MHARFGGGESKKYHERQLVGFLSYKVHLTESCEKGSPHLITHVETTSAPVSDDARTALIHESLKRKDLTRGAAYCRYRLRGCQVARGEKAGTTISTWWVQPAAIINGK